MAQITGTGLKYDVINTPVGHVNDLSETPVSMNLRPDLFFMKLDDSSRISNEAETPNNPIELNLKEFEY